MPSLTPHAFFRPLSSQRLQAYRGGRPTTEGTTTSGEDGDDDTSQKRASMISESTIRHGISPSREGEVPPSRGTEFTDPIIPDRNTSNASPTGNTTIQSLGESVRLLHGREKKPTHLNLANPYKPGSTQDPPQKSPLSFRSGLLSLQNKNDNDQGHHHEGGRHERLSSAATSPRTMVKEPPVRPANPDQNYEYFTGNTVFWGKGRFQNARDRPINIITGILVVLPLALFFAYSAPWLWQHISPAVPIIFAYLAFICMSSFIHASLVNPGILPRNLQPMPPPDPAEDPMTIGPPTNDWVMIKPATSDIAAMDVPVKYCKTCNIWRPPRCYHCRVCDNCVETLDHHCVWLNNCVGRRNYRYFLTFVSAATILSLFMVGACLAQILVYRAEAEISFANAINNWRVPWALVIYGVLAGPYPASLWAYHLFLVGRGETTREHLNSGKFQKADRHRPFTQASVIRNWISVLARPRPPTYLQFKHAYEPGDQRLSLQKRKYQVQDLEAEAGLEMHVVPPDPAGNVPSRSQHEDYSDS